MPALVDQRRSFVDQIDAAIRALPQKPGHSEKDPLPVARLQIQLALYFAPISDLPRAKSASRKRTLSELDFLGALLVRLYKHIQNLHSPALRAIESQKPKRHPLVICDDLIALALATSKATDALPHDALDKKGRKPKTGALQLAQCARSVFERWTESARRSQTHSQPLKRVPNQAVNFSNF